MRQYTHLAGTLALAMAAGTTAQDQAVPGNRTKQRLTILSANDDHVHTRRDKDAKKSTPDSITVIHLGPDHPPIVKTVYGTVPNTISGPPDMAMTGDGPYGFVTSRKSKDDPDAPEITCEVGNWHLPADKINPAHPFAIQLPGIKKQTIPSQA